MTENPGNDGTWVLWVIAIAIVAAVMGAIISSDYEADTTRSCMDNVATPSPEASDYDRQALDFQAEIRKCLRG